MIGFCKEEKPPVFNKWSNRESRVGNNRTITSYLIKKNGVGKSVFRGMTAEKKNKEEKKEFVGNILD